MQRFNNASVHIINKKTQMFYERKEFLQKWDISLYQLYYSDDLGQEKSVNLQITVMYLFYLQSEEYDCATLRLNTKKGNGEL